MKEFFETYKTRPWPKLEVPPIRRPQLIVLILFATGLVAAGWIIWFSGYIQVEYFILLGLTIPILFFLKNRFVTIAGLLCFQVILAFVFIGNSLYALVVVSILIGIIITFESLIIPYALLIGFTWYVNSPLTVGHPLLYEFIITISIILGWLFRSLLRPTSEARPIRFMTLMPALYLLLWISISFALWCPERFPSGWTQYKIVLSNIFLLIVTPLIIRNRTQLIWAIAIWIGIGIVASVATVFAPTVGIQPQPTVGGGGTGVFTLHKNVSASFLSFPFFLVLVCLILAKKSFSRVVYFVSLSIIFIGIISLQSRAAVVGVTIGVIFFIIADALFINPKKSTLKFISVTYSFLAVGALLVIILILGLQNLLGHYSELLGNPTEVSTMRGRQEVNYAVAVEIMTTENHYIRGLGPGAYWSFAVVYGIVRDSESAYNDLRHPHSIYLDIILNYGIIGFALFFWFLWGLVKGLWKVARQDKNIELKYFALGIMAALFGFLVHGLVDFSTYFMDRFWLFSGLAVVLVNISFNIGTSESPKNAK